MGNVEYSNDMFRKTELFAVSDRIWKSSERTLVIESPSIMKTSWQKISTFAINIPWYNFLSVELNPFNINV